jgi:hypothetical protein
MLSVGHLAPQRVGGKGGGGVWIVVRAGGGGRARVSASLPPYELATATSAALVASAGVKRFKKSVLGSNGLCRSRVSRRPTDPGFSLAFADGLIGWVQSQTAIFFTKE